VTVSERYTRPQENSMDKLVRTAAQAKPKQKRLDAVTLIYCPLHLGGPHAGVSMGPTAMKVARLLHRVQGLGYKVAKEVDIKIPDVLSWWERNKQRDSNEGRCVPEIKEVSEAVAEAVKSAMDAGTIAITLGGDHALAIGSIAGASAHYRAKKQDFGLVWFDAHGDINTPDTSPSGNVHGMPFAISLGNGDERLTQINGYSPKISPERCSLIGIRDLDSDEEDLVRRSGVLPFTMRDVDEIGIMNIMNRTLNSIGSVDGLHVSFDLDVIDPDVAPGVSTDSRGGLSYRESHHALELLADTGLVRSIDIVELNPARDVRNRTAELAVELVQSALGKNIL
jgi:arginase